MAVVLDQLSMWHYHRIFWFSCIIVVNMGHWRGLTITKTNMERSQGLCFNFYRAEEVFFFFFFPTVGELQGRNASSITWETAITKITEKKLALAYMWLWHPNRLVHTLLKWTKWYGLCHTKHSDERAIIFTTTTFQIHISPHILPDKNLGNVLKIYLNGIFLLLSIICILNA